jgi:protein TonB
VEAPPAIAPEPPAPAPELSPIETGVPGGVPGGVVAGVPVAEPVAPPPPPPAPERAAPVRVGGKIQPPTVLTRVNPVYPIAAAQANIGGIVILEATVDERGKVETVRVLRSANGLLDHAALEAVRQWEYSPVLLNGTPVRFVLTVTLSFNLDRDS